ncbi:MAG: HAMP domain-containing sensor histidine kinase [Rubricoccaceae bacterium]|nr:HAMP domain-containing sensor histidine kinase [Rubricoccaceae bacterium]
MTSQVDYPYAPVSLRQIVLRLPERQAVVILGSWILATCLIMLSGVLVMRLSTMPIEVGHTVIYLTVYLPLIFSALLAVWFGFWWGAIPAFISHAVVASISGVSPGWALLLGTADPIGLGVLILAFQAAPFTTTLRTTGALVFFILASFVSVLTASAGAFAMTFALNMSPYETLSNWQGWWTGGLLLYVFFVAPTMGIAGPYVERWKRRAGLEPMRPEQQSPSRMAFAFGVAVSSMAAYVLLLRYYGWESLVAANDLAPDVLEALQSLSFLQWITFGFIGMAGYFSFHVAIGWSRTAAELTRANKRLKEELTNRELDQARLVEFAVEQEQARAARDKFFSILSHDLRGPMGSLLGLSQVAEHRLDGHDDKELVEMAGLMNRSAEHLYGLLINLLEWSRLQTGQMRVCQEHLNVADEVDTVFGILSGPASDKGVWLKNRVKPQSFVWADTTMIRSVLLNLVGNALKFTKEGGEVAVRLTRRDAHDVISISDTGVGMSEADQKKLFHMDESLSRRGTAGERGSGLGLLLCRDMIERHGGEITVESALGEGSTFSIALPVRVEAVAEGERQLEAV